MWANSPSPLILSRITRVLTAVLMRVATAPDDAGQEGCSGRPDGAGPAGSDGAGPIRARGASRPRAEAEIGPTAGRRGALPAHAAAVLIRGER